VKGFTAEPQRALSFFVRKILILVHTCIDIKKKKGENMHENNIGTAIVNAAYQVHVRVGPGLLESAYQKCLIFELRSHGLEVLPEVELPLKYRGKEIDCSYRLDMIVHNKVIVEVKSIDKLHDIHTAQLLTYLKLSKCRLGYLINFNVPKIKYGIKRVVNGLDYPQNPARANNN
jgi:GxxExxY protein